MPSSRGGVSRPRRTTPQSPQKPQPQPDLTQTTRRTTRSASREPESGGKQQHASALEAVIEEPGPDGLDLADPSFGYSQVSELSLETQTELQHLDPDLIIEALSGLYDDSLKVLGLFEGLNQLDVSRMSEEAQDPTTITSKRIQFKVTRLLGSLHAFGAVRILINPEMIIRKLRGDHNMTDEGRWRPDAVLYLANTALFLATIVRGTDDQLDELLHRTYPLFPMLFVPSEPISRFATNSTRQTIEIASSLRTQFFIRYVRQHINTPDFNPEDALTDIFYNEEQPRGIECSGLEASLYTKHVSKHVDHLRSFLPSDGGGPIRFDDLEAAFPWSTLIHQALLWATARQAELEHSVSEQGGVDDIVANLQDPDLGNAYMTANAEPVQSSLTSNRPSGRSLLGNLARKKQLDASRAREMDDESFLSQAPSVPDEIAESVAQDNIGTFAVNDDDMASLLVTELQNNPEEIQQITQQGLAHMAQKASQLNATPHPPPPAARFIDRQAGAQRLSFDDASPGGPSRKRAPVPETDDGEFQTDIRTQTKRRRMEDHNIDPALRGDELPAWDMSDDTSPQPTLPPPPPPRQRGGRPRTTGVAAAQASSSAPAATADPSTPDPSALSQSSVPPMSTANNGDLGSAELLREVQEEAKAKGRQRKNHLLLHAPPGTPDPTQNTLPASQSVSYQERKAWKPEEEQRLFDLVGVHGPAYSKILKDDANDPMPRLQDRSQVQLKDKTRNIKFAFLKAGRPLLPGFGAVSIGKKMVEKLRAMGIPIEGDGRDKAA